jgi:hypothetical protein
LPVNNPISRVVLSSVGTKWNDVVVEQHQLDVDRIDLTVQRGITDATFRHIAMALRAGVQSGAALDRMYGEALAF